jgi:hypothetical protein
MSVGASVVAYYGEKRRDQPELADLITGVQEVLTRTVAGQFHARDLFEVHATIVGLEGVKNYRRPRLSDLLLYLRGAFDAGMTIQFGGFSPTYIGMRSRELTLYERSFTVSGGDVMLMGWPVESGAPSAALDTVRRQCEQLGFEHKYYSDDLAVDPDCYLSIGRLDDGARVKDLELLVREHLSQLRSASAQVPDGIRVPLRSADISIVLYEDRRLARASSAVYSL